MKYCSMPFEYLYLDHYNGNVFLCPWMEPEKCCIGNLFEEDIESIWKGEKAEFFRNTIRNGSYEYCRIVGCPYLQNNDLPEYEYDENDSRWQASQTPKEINLAFDFICNQSCPTCRCEVFVPEQDYGEKVEKIIEEILPYIAKSRKVTASGHGDPFASPYMMKLFENLHPENPDMEIWFETNGVFFDEEHWKRIEHLSKYDLKVIVTTNSYYEPIYNQISRGGNLTKLKRNELFLKQLREEKKVRTTTNAFVIQEKNYWEIPEFIEKSFDVYGFDKVVLRPVYNWGNLTKEEFWFKDVLNPLHPYHEEYKKIIELPIVKDNSRVYNFGGDMMHEPMPMPGGGDINICRLEDYYELFKMWISEKDVDERINRFIKLNKAKNIAVYGAGTIGRAIMRIIKNNLVYKSVFVDISDNLEVIDGTDVYRPEDERINYYNLLIITPIWQTKEIVNNLYSYGYHGKIASVLDIFER